MRSSGATIFGSSLRTASGIYAAGPVTFLGGDQSAEAHAYVASVAKELDVHLIAVGTDGYRPTAQQTVSTIEEAVAALGSLDANDAVLVKGSRIAGLERLATALLAG